MVVCARSASFVPIHRLRINFQQISDKSVNDGEDRSEIDCTTSTLKQQIATHYLHNMKMEE